jgi:hypothetical protein
LPWVLLGIRTAFKEDLQSLAAELVYGEPLRLPGEFFESTMSGTTGMSVFTARLRSFAEKLKPPGAVKLRYSFTKNFQPANTYFFVSTHREVPCKLHTLDPIRY